LEKKKGIKEYQEKFGLLIERLKPKLDSEGISPANRIIYYNFIKSACKELRRRSKEEETKVIRELVERWTQKGLKKEILEQIAKLLPYWCEALYRK
jgi:hypothetical protein